MLEVTLVTGQAFVDPQHRYWIEGLGPFPSTTKIINTGKYYPAAAAARGTRVHEACEAYDLYGETFADLDISSYVEAWQGFRNDFADRMEIYSVEQSFVACVDDLHYGGTIDRLVVLDGERYVLDIKSGVKDTWHGLQLAAYGIPQGITKGIDVYVGKNGLYRVSVHEHLDELFLEFKDRLGRFSW